MHFKPRPLIWPPVFPVNKNLVLNMPFDARSGSRVYDRSGKGNHGTLYGPTWIATDRRPALQFDGSDDYVDAGNDASLSLDDELTLLAWITGTAPNVENNILTKRGTQDNYELQVLSSGYVRILLKTTSGFEVFQDTTTLVNDGTLHCVGATIKSGGAVKIYVDGSLAKSFSMTGTLLTDDTDKVYIGSRKTSDLFWTGTIFGVAIAEKIFTAAEMKRASDSELRLVRY